MEFCPSIRTNQMYTSENSRVLSGCLDYFLLLPTMGWPKKVPGLFGTYIIQHKPMIINNQLWMRTILFVVTWAKILQNVSFPSLNHLATILVLANFFLVSLYFMFFSLVTADHHKPHTTWGVGVKTCSFSTKNDNSISSPLSNSFSSNVFVCFPRNLFFSKESVIQEIDSLSRLSDIALKVKTFISFFF